MQLTKRLAHGFTSSGSYTWSRSLGTDIVNGAEDQVVNSRDPRNRSLDKALLTFQGTHLLTTNATVELPNRDTQNNPFLLDLNINSPNFGRFTDAQGARRFTLGARLNF